jgi:hypothetical protein
MPRPRDDRRLQPLLDAVDQATQQVVDRYRRGEAGGEERLSGAWGQAIDIFAEQHLRHHQHEGVEWEVRVIDVPIAEEKRAGHDLVIVVRWDLAEDGQGPAMRAEKGIVVQAKRHDRMSSGADRERLDKQVDKIRRVTTSGWISIYTPEGVEFVPVETLTNPASRMLSVDVRELFGRIVDCDSGDETLRSRDDVMRRVDEVGTLVEFAAWQRYRRRPRR